LKTVNQVFLKQLSDLIFIFGVCGIPIILFLTIALKLTQRLIDKL